jgi:hypothetical protein
VRSSKSNWHKLPIGARLTITEAASYMNVLPSSIRTNYLTSSPHRRLPENIMVIRENKRAVLIQRTA